MPALLPDGTVLPFDCWPEFVNEGEVEVRQRVARFESGFRQEGAQSVLRLEQAAMDFARSGRIVEIGGGRLEGNESFCAVAEIGGSEAAVLTGKDLSFERLKLLPSSRVQVVLTEASVSGNSFFVRAEGGLDIGGILDVRFGDGFEERVTAEQTFGLFRLNGNAAGRFSNVAAGERLAVGESGTFAFESREGGIVLADFQPLLKVELGADPLMYWFPEQGRECILAPNATVKASPTFNWEGAELQITISSGYVINEDQWHGRSEGSGPGLLGLGPLDENGAGPLSFDGLGIGTIRIAGATVRCRFTSGASAAAVSAVLQRLVYVNSAFAPGWFRDADLAFPGRRIRVSLTAAGETRNEEREVVFPKMVGITTGEGAYEMVASVTYLLSIRSQFIHDDPGQAFFIELQRLRYAVSGCESIAGVALFGRGNGIIVSALAKGECTLEVSTGRFRTSRFLRIKGNELDPSERGGEKDCPIDLGEQASTKEPGGGRFAGGSTAVAAPMATVSLATFHAMQALMNGTPEGRQLARLYWQHAGEVAGILRRKPEVLRETAKFLVEFQPVVRSLLVGEPSGGMISAETMTKLNAIATLVAQEAGPELKEAIENGQALFNSFADFSGKSSGEWARMLGLPVPTEAFLHLSSAGVVSNIFRVRANAIPNYQYTLWKSADPGAIGWEAVPNSVVNEDFFTVELSDPTPSGGGEFYRITAEPILAE